MMNLCPSAKNELGKNILDNEGDLLARGYLFACRVPHTLVGTLLVCKRPITDAVTDGELDSLSHKRQRTRATLTP